MYLLFSPAYMARCPLILEAKGVYVAKTIYDPQ